MKMTFLAILSAMGLAHAAAAEDGFYYGIGIGVTESSTFSPVISTFEASGRDFSLALTAGYRIATTGPLSFGVEGNLDALTGDPMEDAAGREACTDASPTWCEVDTVLRLRGTASAELANGSRIAVSLGPVLVNGRAEERNSVYRSTSGHGVSVGVSWENFGSSLPVRVDLNYDRIRDDDLAPFERELDMIGLRASYMF
jgi:Outer membrane protein beta-barrel domain